MKNNFNILFAEDSKVVQHLVKVTLQTRFNCTVSCCETSADTILSIQDNIPDILILDYHLGKIATSDYADTVLDYTENREIHIPIIFFSSIKDRNVQSRLYDRGVYHIVSKNSDFFIDELNTCVSSIIKWIQIR